MLFRDYNPEAARQPGSQAERSRHSGPRGSFRCGGAWSRSVSCPEHVLLTSTSARSFVNPKLSVHFYQNPSLDLPPATSHQTTPPNDMYDSQKPHPLLAQVPLSVSPFISLPTAPPLPHTYKSLPSTLPPSITVDPSSSTPTEPVKYVISPSGHTSSPAEILSSCRALQAHLSAAHAAADKTISEWEASIKERELAEKRRLAPGWLDSSQKILEPTKAPSNPGNLMDSDSKAEGKSAGAGLGGTMTPSREGEDLDRAFGGMGLK
jgi:hypothetical protein